MRWLWWLVLLLVAVVVAAVWPRDEPAQHVRRSGGMAAKPPERHASPWLIAVDPAGRPLQPSISEEFGLYAIRCPGYVTEAYLPRPDDKRPLTITLTPAATMRGRVVLGNVDHPAVGVRIECHEWPDGRTARTDKDGRFELPDLNPAGDYFPQFELPGFLPPEVNWSAGQGEILVILGDGGTLRGLIVEPDGRPVAGMPVLLRGHDLFASEVDGETFAVVSGPDGRFEFRGLAGPMDYRVIASDNRRKGESAIAAIEEEKGDRTCVVVVSERPRLRVRVMDPDGASVAHAQVTADKEWPQSFPAVAPGVYLSGPLSLGTQALFVAVIEWPERSLNIAFDRVEVREIEVRFQEAHTLRGRVVDDTGRPVESASVSTETGFTDTDGDGRFVLRGLTADPVALSIEHHGHNPVAVTLAPTDAEHRITMPRAATLTGRLEPVPASRKVDCRFFSTEFDSAHVRVDVFGRFAVRELPSGEEFDITFEIDGWIGVPMRRVTLAPGEARDVGVLRPPPGATLEGVVRDNYGHPVGDAHMNLESRMQEVKRWMITDATGTYRFEDLPLVKAELEIHGRGFATRTFELELGGQQTFDVVVIRSGLLVGTAKGAAELRLVPVTGGQPLRWNPEDDGTFSVNAVPGRYRLQYRLGAPWIAGALVDIAEGRTTRVGVTVSGH